jgi:hypothetical protein
LVGVQKHHVVLSGAAIIVVVMLGFATAFIVDAANTNRTYDALAGHRVQLSGHVLGCSIFRSSRGGSNRLCRIGFDFEGYRFTEVIGSNLSQAAYVDPGNPALHMSKVDFDGGPEERTVDLTLAALLIAGAFGVGILHELHRRRRRIRSTRDHRTHEHR